LARIAALSVRVGTKIEDASRDAELRRAREELAEAHKAAHALDREVSRLRGDRVVAEDQVADIEARAEAVNSRLEAARNSEAAAAPTLRHKLRLLVLIAPVKWDLDAPAGTLRGREPGLTAAAVQSRLARCSAPPDEANPPPLPLERSTASNEFCLWLLLPPRSRRPRRGTGCSRDL